MLYMLFCNIRYINMQISSAWQCLFNKLQIDFFVYTLEKYGCASYGHMLQKATVKVLEMKWSAKEDTTDCGLYAMRHMETYMGMKVTDWKCDLTNKQSRPLQLLRAKYCTAMLYNNNNRAFRCVSRLASHQYTKAKKTRPIDVENMVAEYKNKPSWCASQWK